MRILAQMMISREKLVHIMLNRSHTYIITMDKGEEFCSKSLMKLLISPTFLQAALSENSSLEIKSSTSKHWANLCKDCLAFVSQSTALFTSLLIFLIETSLFSASLSVVSIESLFSASLSSTDSYSR